jgi:cytochrome c556
MNKFILVVGILVVLLFLLVACGENLQPQVEELEKKVAELEQMAGPPPAFLDRLYPPQAPAPVYLIEMMALDQAFVGLFADLFEQDFANIPGDMEAFKAQYDKMRNEVVPEWKDRFPLAPIAALEEALASQDPDQIMPAAMGIGEVCGNCHVVYMTKVQQKYHWPRFDKVMVTDPLTKQNLPWSEFKLPMAINMSGIGHNLQQGQLDNAKQSFQAFNAQFAALRQACSACHATKRTYFVDDSVQADIDALGEALETTPPDTVAIPSLMQKIGQESCGKCHLVHVPAAEAQKMWP